MDRWIDVSPTSGENAEFRTWLGRECWTPFHSNHLPRPVYQGRREVTRITPRDAIPRCEKTLPLRCTDVRLTVRCGEPQNLVIPAPTAIADHGDAALGGCPGLACRPVLHWHKTQAIFARSICTSAPTSC